VAKLIVARGDGNKREVDLTNKVEVVIGRALECDLVVMDHMVSRRHAKVVAEAAGGHALVDNGSANGVFLNDQSVTRQKLREGDRIQIGQALLIYHGDTPSGSQAKVTLAGKGEGGLAGLSMVGKISDLRPEFGTISPTDNKTMLGLVSNFRKEAEQKSAFPSVAPHQAAKEQREKFHFFVLFQLAQASNIGQSTEELFSQVLDLLVESLDASCGAIMIKGPDGELQAAATRDLRRGGQGELMVSRTIAEQVLRERVAVLTRDAANDPRFAQGASIAAMQINSAVCCPIWDGDDVDGIVYFVAAPSRIFTESDRDLVTAAGHQLAVAMRQEALQRQLQEEAAARSHLERYHSADVVEALLKQGSEGLSVKDTYVTVLFADIEGFTTLSQRLSPGRMAKILNGYFDATTEAIFRHRGQVNKYIGDAILAVFGAPIENPNQAIDACNAALDMITALHKFLQTLPVEDRFRIRIAINGGPVVAGNIGAQKRLEYTVIGTTVNMCSRLEKFAPPDGVVVGPETAAAVKHAFRLRSIGPQDLKGLSAPVEVFELEGHLDDDSTGPISV
jgi:adenylate cyclase